MQPAREPAPYPARRWLPRLSLVVKAAAAVAALTALAQFVSRGNGPDRAGGLAARDLTDPVTTGSIAPRPRRAEQGLDQRGLMSLVSDAQADRHSGAPARKR
jgi:hypothetical protein